MNDYWVQKSRTWHLIPAQFRRWCRKRVHSRVKKGKKQSRILRTSWTLIKSYSSKPHKTKLHKCPMRKTTRFHSSIFEQEKQQKSQGISASRFLRSSRVYAWSSWYVDELKLRVNRIFRHGSSKGSIKVGHEYVKPWFIWSSGLGSRLALRLHKSQLF